MCERCAEIDATIGRYEWIKTQIIDPKTVQATNDLVAKLKAEKAALHPEKEK
jgi:hypothetical protein